MIETEWDSFKQERKLLQEKFEDMSSQLKSKDWELGSLMT